jgi:hypothetical protein
MGSRLSLERRVIQSPLRKLRRKFRSKSLTINWSHHLHRSVNDPVISMPSYVLVQARFVRNKVATVELNLMPVPGALALLSANPAVEGAL